MRICLLFSSRQVYSDAIRRVSDSLSSVTPCISAGDACQRVELQDGTFLGCICASFPIVFVLRWDVMARFLRFLSYVMLVLAVGTAALAAAAPVGGSGIGGTIIGLSNDNVYEVFGAPSFVEAGADGQVFSFTEWEAFSAANPTEQGNDGIIDVKNGVIIKYYVGYVPDYSKGRFTPGFLVSEYRVEADKYIRLEDLPLYFADTMGIVKAVSIHSRPTELRSLGSQVTGSVITYLLDTESLSEVFGTSYADKRIVISVRVLDGEALGYPGERLVDSYHVRIVGEHEIDGLGERIDR